MSFNKIMRYVRNNGGVTLAGKGKIVKFDSGYQVSYTNNVCDNNYNTINFLLRRLCNGIDYTGIWLEDNMYLLTNHCTLTICGKPYRLLKNIINWLFGTGRTTVVCI